MRRVIALVIVLASTAVACGVVDDGKVERIQPQFGVDDTLPSTTRVATTTTQAATTTTVSPETPTTPVVVAEQVTLYFVDSGQLTPVIQSLASPTTLNRIVVALQIGPPEDEVGAGLSTIVPNDIEIRVATDGNGVAEVTLPAGFFELIPGPPNDQRLVIAQLVLTITSSRGIGQVTFNQAVPLPSGQVRLPGQELTFRDYAIYTNSSQLVIPDPIPASGTTTP